MGGGWTKAQKGGTMHILGADSRCCMEETNTTCKAVTLQLKINLKKSYSWFKKNSEDLKGR